MKHPALKLAALAAVTLVVLAGAGGAAAQEPLIINEILADPASDWDGDGTIDFKGDEWIEVINVGDTTIDLSTYWLRDDTGTENHLQLSGMLPRGEVAVFYGSQAVAWQASQGLSTTGFSLNNDGDVVRLLRTIPGSPDFELMYVAHYEDHLAEDDRSCGWNFDMNDWELFDALLPYTGSLVPGGNGCAPTPGLPNICTSQVATEALTYGAVKAMYR